MGYGSPYFMDLRYLQKKAEEDSIGIIEKVGREYQTLLGSSHVGLLESHRCEDAEMILITMGIVYPSVRFVVNALREKGVRIGCLKLRVFRPFPAEALIKAVKDAKLLITIDRNSVAALYKEIRGALYSLIGNGPKAESPLVMGKVMGIGGTAISLDHIGQAVEEGLAALQDGFVKKELEWFPLQGIQFDPTRDTIAE